MVFFADTSLDMVAMEAYMKEIGVAMNIRRLGATDDMLEGVAEGSFIRRGGYKVLCKWRS